MVVIEMEDGGIMEIELYPDKAPVTVANFEKLVKSGFYDGLGFHRIIEGFMIQGGDPDGNGMGGPGWHIKGEFASNGVNNDLKHTRGVISMARSAAPDSAGSQFFIMHEDAPHLDGQYAAFGKLVSGYDVLDGIASVRTGFRDEPIYPQIMKKVYIKENGMKYGIQLYSMRDLAEKDFEAAVAKAAEIGYSSIEFAGFFGRSAEQVNELLKKNNIELFGTHCGMYDLVNDFEGTLAFHKAIGNKNYIISHHHMRNRAEIDEFVGLVNKYQPMLEAEGIKLGYHNHSMEWLPNEDGIISHPELLNRTNIGFEIDTFWAFNAGRDPVALMEQYKDRLQSIHIKDGFAGGRGMPLGRGEAPVAAVYAKAKELGVPMIVESETCDPTGPDEAQICYDYLKSLE
ncbi:MAG: peptidylprolyl isomerase [Clostridia bacterium]|nr:peptidylprolyl isomerase [Clostridia bacterium]